MRKIWIVAILALFLYSCTGRTDTEKGKDNQDIKDKTGDVNTGTSEGNIKEISSPVKISEDEFVEKVFDFRSSNVWKYKGDKPCVVDFYADWCGPCRMIAPYMENLAKKYSGKIIIYKVNTDYARDLSLFFNIKSIPAVMFCSMKGEPQFVFGAYPEEQYDNYIRDVLLAE